MYITGGIEILLIYLLPQMAIPAFGPITEPSSLYNHCRIYGTVALIIIFCVVSIGIKFVAITGFVTLVAVLGTIVFTFIGMFTMNESNSPDVCMVGNRLWRMNKVHFNGEWCCVKDEYCPGVNNQTTAPLYNYYCGGGNETDPDLCEYFTNNEVGLIKGIPGILSGTIVENLWPAYATGENEIIGANKVEKKLVNEKPNMLYGNRRVGEIVTDMSTSFLVIIGIFFPSATGIFAGSNRSGDLADPGRAIPLGTIGANLVTTVCYLAWVVIFAASMKGQVLRDKLGESMTTSPGGSLMAGNIAWPHPLVAQIGSFLATMGAGLQSLTSAPRLLNALAKDDVIPFLKPFAYVTKRGEPIYAQLVAAGIAWLGILLGTIDLIGPVVTMFFLICYSAINTSCAINSILKPPNWRPRFRFYHWTLSGVGVILGVIIMFMSNWWQALIAIGIGCFVYKYIEYTCAEKDWGDGLRGVQMAAALAAIHRLPLNDRNAKNWRPQLLLFCKNEEDPETKKLNLLPMSTNLFAFAKQLKAGKGLVVIGSVIEGKFLEKKDEATELRATIMARKDVAKLHAMPCVVVAPQSETGLTTLIQSTGIGALRPNTVLVGWPRTWRDNISVAANQVHLLPNLLRVADAAEMSTIVVRNIDVFPTSKKERMLGTVDIWWIVQDCGLLLMVPYLLQQHKVWERTKLRIFVVTLPSLGVDVAELRAALKEFVYETRITCTFEVVELGVGEISAFVYQRTLNVEDRANLFSQLQAARRAGKGGGAKSTTGENGLLSPPTTYGEEEARKKVSENPESRNFAEKLNSAHSFNQAMLARSKDADLVVVNLPAPPKRGEGDFKYMEYVDLLTDGFSRVVLIRSSKTQSIVTTKFAEN